jgi:type VI secretion system secreted protein VgrG
MNLLQDAAALLAGLAGERQGQRLLRLSFPRGDGPASMMLANAICADEAISRDFCYEVEVLSDDALIPLKAVMGKMVTVSLVRNDGTLRYFNGYVFDFRFVRTDAGFAFYSMTLKPWLAFLQLRQDSRVFQNLNVLELCEKTFENYLQRDYQYSMLDTPPDMTLLIQYNESDHNHVHRRLEQAGLHYWYEHREDGHTMWISDDSTRCEPVDGGGAMRYQNAAGAKEDDGIHVWSPVRHASSGKVTVGSYDFKSARAERSDRPSLNEQGAVQAYEVYESMGAYGFRDYEAGEALATRRMEAIDSRGQDFTVNGNDRVAQPGRCFRITEHFSGGYRCSGDDDPANDIAGREYLILSAQHKASNNYQDGRHALSSYSSSFTCLRKNTRWRPTVGLNSKDTRIHGVQTATVVGPEGQEIYTDEYGRVRVQFHWDREGKFDGASSPWVRVMTSTAGQGFGQIAVPRVKQEVVVMFLDGVCDRPLIVGSVYNGANMPPWQLSDQKALTGRLSRELGGERGNHLVLDDTHGKIQAQLKSDHLCSQLSLGHIARIDGRPGRQDERGEGFELRSDGHGVLRAGKGMLLTTEARAGASGHIKDMGETRMRLAAAQQQHEALAKLTQQFDQGAKQVEVAAMLKTQCESVQGKPGAGDGFPELSAPHLVLASPAGMTTTTAGSTHISSEQHTAVTTGKSLSLATGDSLFASIQQAFRLFVHKAGMKMIAAAGDIDLQALQDSVNVLAKLNITHSANRITISAKEELVINGGGTYLKFNAGAMELGTSGSFVSHAAKHSLVGPKNMDVAIAMPSLKDSEGKGAFNLGSHAAAAGRPSADLPVKLYRDDVMVEQGKFDAAGNLVFKHEMDKEAKYRIVVRVNYLGRSASIILAGEARVS